MCLVVGLVALVLPAAVSAGPSQPPEGLWAPPAGSVPEDNVLLAAEAGIGRGYPDGTFRPGRRVTRGQLGTFLYAAMRR